MKVQKDTRQNWWESLTSTVRQTWRQTNAMFSRSLIFTTTVMTIINFTIQFGLVTPIMSYYDYIQWALIFHEVLFGRFMLGHKFDSGWLC